MKNVLLIIDPQNDFCKPGAPLYVNGAENDIQRIIDFIKANELSHIVVSMDMHQPFSVFHPSFWENADGEMPSEFMKITAQDVKDGVWTPLAAPITTLSYLESLEKSGEYAHTIWPEHCIAGSEGAAIVPELIAELTNWSRKGNRYEIISKGRETLTEFYGAFRAQVPLPGIVTTDWNLEAINRLAKYDNVFIAGEAKSHCVAQTVKQLFEFPDVRKKLIVLEDCMSNVSGFETIADDTWNKAKSIGVKFAKSTDTFRK